MFDHVRRVCPILCSSAMLTLIFIQQGLCGAAADTVELPFFLDQLWLVRPHTLTSTTFVNFLCGGLIKFDLILVFNMKFTLQLNVL